MAYSPASTTTATSGLNHLASIFYDRAAVDNLKAHLPFYEACERKKLPNRNGKTIQFYTYNLMAANTSPGSEGTVGSGIAPQTSTISVPVNQYFDFVSFSDLLVDTAIDDIVMNTAAELGYRAALTVNTLVSAAFDVAVAADASANILLAHGAYMTRSVAQQAVMSLRAKNVRAKDNGQFMGIIHPLVAFDLWNDNSAGSLLDWNKYTIEGQDQFKRGIQGFKVAELAGCTWIETTTCPTYTINTFTNYGSYVVGKDAIMAVNLGGTEAPQDEKNFSLLINRNLAPSAADPANVIGSTAAYNFKFAAIQRPGTVMALRRIQSEASIS
jgi:N4-gp56 family major capsid protein